MVISSKTTLEAKKILLIKKKNDKKFFKTKRSTVYTEFVQAAKQLNN